jgi:predicted lipid-binding transport protein (Tim44 family)
MNKELMEIVLPRLAQRLNRQLRRYRAGELNDAQFSHKFEMLLQQQYAWLANQGIPEVEAAIAVHGAVLVLSGPGLRAEATEQSVPLEVVEFGAIRAAAADIASNYDVSESKTIRRLSALVAFYAE